MVEGRAKAAEVKYVRLARASLIRIEQLQSLVAPDPGLLLKDDLQDRDWRESHPFRCRGINPQSRT